MILIFDCRLDVNFNKHNKNMLWKKITNPSSKCFNMTYDCENSLRSNDHLRLRDQAARKLFRFEVSPSWTCRESPPRRPLACVPPDVFRQGRVCRQRLLAVKAAVGLFARVAPGVHL